MRIAVAQTPGTRLGEWRETRALILEVIRAAAGQRAELVVLPECVWPAYCIGSRQAYEDARLAGLPSPAEFLAEIGRLTGQLSLSVCLGYIEEDAGRLYNSAALFGPDGKLHGTRRKCFLWDFDRDYFTPGECVEPVQADFGRAGIMICADARLPEIPAALAARGAELFLQPTAWVNAGTPAQPWNPQPDFLIRSRAAEFGIPCASASKWGVEAGTQFVGSSLICDARGEILAQCGPAETRIVTAEVTPQPARPPIIRAAEADILRTNSVPALTAPHGPLRLVPLASAADRDAARRTFLAGKYAESCTLGISTSDWQSSAGLLLLSGPQGAATIPLGTALDSARIRVVGIGGHDVNRFACIRRHALGGAHAVVAFGDDAMPIHLQARACENRVFIIHVAREGWRVVSPSGKLILDLRFPGNQPANRPIEVDVSAALDKSVARDTYVLGGRATDAPQL